MKYQIKAILFLFTLATVTCFYSCSNNNESNLSEEIEQNITKGLWIKKIDKADFVKNLPDFKNNFINKDFDKDDLNLFIKNLPESIEHYLVFENNRFKEHVAFQNDGVLKLFDVAASIQNNILSVSI